MSQEVSTTKDRIKAVRKSVGLTQQEFADRLHMKRNSIANYEIGRNEPIDAVIALICREFGVDELWLRTGSGEMFQARSREDELDALITQLWRDDPSSDSFKSRFIAAALRIGPDGWAAVEKFCRELVAENEKEEQEP